MKIVKLIIILSMLSTPILAENTSKSEDKLSAKQQREVVNLMRRFMIQYENAQQSCKSRENAYECQDKPFMAKKTLEDYLKNTVIINGEVQE